MEDLIQAVHELQEMSGRMSRLIEGDPDDRKRNPGVIVELAAVQSILKEMRDSQKWLNRLVFGAVILAVLKLVLA